MHTNSAEPQESLRFRPIGHNQFEAQRGGYLFVVRPEGQTRRGKPIFIAKVIKGRRPIYSCQPFLSPTGAKSDLQAWDRKHLGRLFSERRP